MFNQLLAPTKNSLYPWKIEAIFNGQLQSVYKTQKVFNLTNGIDNVASIVCNLHTLSLRFSSP